MDIDETFAELDRAELLSLANRSDAPGLMRLAVQLPWLIASGIWLLMAQDAVWIALALIANSLAQTTFFAPLHETCHRTAFANRRLNFAVAWIAGFIQLTAPSGMRAFHFAHHRHTHDWERDPELGGMRMQLDWPRGLLLLANTSGLPILVVRAVWMVFSAVGIWPESVWALVMPFVSMRDRPGVVRDSRLMVLAHLGLMAVALSYPPVWRLYGAMWLGHAVLSVYLAAEHRGLEHSDQVLECTRSFAGNPVVDWLMWNMPYHAEHHGWPGVPFHALPALHERAGEKVTHRDARLMVLYQRGGG